MLLWILMMAAPVIIGGILKLVRKDAATGGKHSAKSRPAVAVSTNVPSVRVQQAGPSLPAAELAIKSHVLKAALVAAAGVVLVLLALIWSFSVKPEGEIFMFLMFLEAVTASTARLGVFGPRGCGRPIGPMLRCRPGE